MKKLFSLIICISVLVMSISGLNLTVFAALEGDGTEENPYIITTADDFKGIWWTADTYYLITGDIDLTSGYTPRNFNGHLKGAVKEDGTKYKVTVNITSQDKNIGVFPAITGGSIENLEFAGAIAFSGSTATRIGGITGMFSNCDPTIKNCINSINISGESTNADAAVGGIVGYPNKGTITGCENKGTINVSVPLGVGGISGQSQGSHTVSDCTNSGAVTNAKGHTGGIAGRTHTNDIISGCINSGVINAGANSATAYIGGIVGYQNAGTVDSCFNKGTFKSDTLNTNVYAGGISGYNAGTISKCANLSGEIAVRQFGGIAGRNGGSIMLSYNALDLPNADGWKGGIAARNDKTISNCFNIGNAQGQHSGGIVGAFNGGTISNVYTVVSTAQVNTICGANSGTLTNAYYVIKDGGSVTGTLTGTEATFDELIKNTTDFSDANGWQVLAISDTNKYPLPQLKDNPYYLAFSICRAKDNVVITAAPVTQIPDMVEEGEEYTIKGSDGDYTIKSNTRYAAIFSKVNEYYGWGIKEYGVEVDGVQYPSKLSLTSDLSYGIVLENTPEEITVKSYAVYYEINNPDNKITVYSNVE